MRGELALDDKNSVLALNLGRNFDSITNGAGGIATQRESLNGGSTTRTAALPEPNSSLRFLISSNGIGWMSS